MTTRRSRNRVAASRGLDLVQRSDRVEASLWRRAKIEGSEDARAHLFEGYRPLAQKIAGAEFARRRELGCELDEVRQLALEGLLQAIGSYDATMGVPFAAFARRRVRGSILDGLAKATESAAQYRFRKRLERDRLRSVHEEGRQGGDSLEELGKLTTLIAIGLMLEEGAAVDPDHIATSEANAYDTLAWSEMQQRLSALIEKLGERERFVLTQHYHHEVSFNQIAEVLGLSKGRVSQIHKSALLRLRAELERFR